MSDLLLRGKVDMSSANQSLRESVEQVRRYEHEIESAASSTGRFERTIQQQMREARNLLVQLEQTGRGNTEEFRKAQMQLAQLTDQMQDMRQATQMLASDTASLDVAKNSLTGMVTAMAALQSVTALTGTESQSMNKIMNALKTTIAAVTAAITLANLAQKQFITTMMANPWGLAIAGITAIASALLSLAGSAKEAEKAMADAYAAQLKFYSDAYVEESSFNYNYKMANDEKNSWDVRLRAVHLLNQAYPELEASLDSETKKLKLNAFAWANVSRSIRANAKIKEYQTILENRIKIRDQLMGKAEAAQRNGDLDDAAEYRAQAAALKPEIDKYIRMINEQQISAVRNYRKKKQQPIKIDPPKIKIDAPKEISFDEWKTTFDEEHAIMQQDLQTRADYYKKIYEDQSRSLAERQKAYRDYVDVMEKMKEEELEKYLALRPDTNEKLSFDQLKNAVKQQWDLENQFAAGPNDSWDQKHEKMQAELDYLQEFVNNESNLLDDRLEAYKLFLDKKKELEDEEIVHSQLVIDQTLRAAANITSSVASAIGSIAQMDKDSKDLKAAQILATAIANVLQGYAAASAQAASGGPIAWAAFSIAGLAQVTSVIAEMSNLYNSRPTYAQGGIINGATTIGDYNLARVNSGEMILNGTQQKRMFDILNGENSINRDNLSQKNVVFRISGTELVGVIDNYTRSHRRTI